MGLSLALLIVGLGLAGWGLSGRNGWIIIAPIGWIIFIVSLVRLLVPKFFA